MPHMPAATNHRAADPTNGAEMGPNQTSTTAPSGAKSEEPTHPQHRHAALCMAITLLLIHRISHPRHSTWRLIR